MTAPGSLERDAKKWMPVFRNRSRFRQSFQSEAGGDKVDRRGMAGVGFIVSGGVSAERLDPLSIALSRAGGAMVTDFSLRKIGTRGIVYPWTGIAK